MALEEDNALVEKILIVIREQREKKALSVNELSQRCGIAPEIIQRIETGKHELFIYELKTITKGLDMKMSSLVKLAEKKTNF
ncbi:multiprotein-bridging factor 1 family protein [Candidatus Riflebacteria bacterium]